MPELTADSTVSLREALGAALQAQIMAGDERRLLVAQSTLKEFLQRNGPLPADITCTPRPHVGKRVPVRGRMAKAAKEPVSAVWPDDHLIEIRAPYFIYAINGQADFHAGNYSLHLQPGYFCLIPSEVPRTNGALPHLDGERQVDGQCDLMWVRASEGGIELWTCHSHKSEHIGGRIRQRVLLSNQQLWFYISHLVREAEEKSAESALLCQSLLKIVLVLILRELRSTQFRPSLVDGIIKPETGPDWDPIRHARSYIIDNLQEHLTIERVARASYMASSQFRQRFRQATGKTFTQYLTECRLERAKVLLRDTDWTVAVIASLVGINPSHLRRLFMRYSGTSPQEFRRRAKKRHLK